MDETEVKSKWSLFGDVSLEVERQFDKELFLSINKS